MLLFSETDWGPEVAKLHKSNTNVVHMIYALFSKTSEDVPLFFFFFEEEEEQTKMS